ncbi:NAD(P)H-dependent flavin oxidoreductase [Pseudalkalibacillus hwajinpoensis]|uniref:Probable nitronate monooxygenase n=1 Tax=Guptibacillus hwajinpoensis TaxID=208199 RepID=A0A4U1MJE0_9BACL|nr:nitronate monooxygenase [Pseudalkalibacillus hwajinpoensis]TKD70704.1 nitronate monooxygenase [Pseudalkalibacillus hwajinpoensis]
MWNKTELTRILQIEYPIIQAPMAGGPTTPELVSEVSNAGGLGMIGAGYLSADQLKTTIQDVKQRTNLPFGVNLFVVKEENISEVELHKSFQTLETFRKKLNLSNELPEVKTSLEIERHIEMIIEENVPVCSFTFGIPDQSIINRLKENKITVIGTATTVEEAIAVERAGMDAIVAQGSEAGGHRGSFLGGGIIGTMALAPQVDDHVKIPVIASGGIMDGRGFAAATMLGAEGVQMGTVFLTTRESGAHDLHKKAIMDATEENTVLTKSFSGKEARGIENEFIRLMNENAFIAPYPIQNSLTKSIRKEAAKQGNAHFMSLWAGQGTRMNKETTVKELFEELVLEINAKLN